MFKKIRRIAAFLIVLSTPAVCYADSISTAINIVEGFEVEVNTLLDKLGPKETAATRKSLSEERVKAVDELKTLGWTHAPGDIRYRRTFNIVDSYSGRILAAVGALNKRLPLSAGARVQETVRKLTELKGASLTDLNESRKNELAGEKAVRPVPLIDRSPFDTTPGEAPGMWYR